MMAATESDAVVEIPREEATVDEMIIDKDKVPLIENIKERISTMFHVQIQYDLIVDDPSGPKQWVRLIGNADDRMAAKDLIKAFCNPQASVKTSFPVALHKILSNPKIHTNLEKQTKTAIVFLSNAKIQIQGCDTLSVTLALSTIDDLVNKYLQDFDMENSEQISPLSQQAALLLNRELDRLNTMDDTIELDEDYVSMNDAVKRTILALAKEDNTDNENNTLTAENVSDVVSESSLPGQSGNPIILCESDDETDDGSRTKSVATPKTGNGLTKFPNPPSLDKINSDVTFTPKLVSTPSVPRGVNSKRHLEEYFQQLSKDYKEEEVTDIADLKRRNEERQKLLQEAFEKKKNEKKGNTVIREVKLVTQLSPQEQSALAASGTRSERKSAKKQSQKTFARGTDRETPGKKGTQSDHLGLPEAHLKRKHSPMKKVSRKEAPFSGGANGRTNDAENGIATSSNNPVVLREPVGGARSKSSHSAHIAKTQQIPITRLQDIPIPTTQQIQDTRGQDLPLTSRASSSQVESSTQNTQPPLPVDLKPSNSGRPMNRDPPFPLIDPREAEKARKMDIERRQRTKWGSPNERRKLRYIVIDGSNVAMEHGNHQVFSCQGIQLCVNYFYERGHREITAVVPQWRTRNISKPISNQNLLHELKKKGHLVFCPSRRVPDGRNISPYDDRFLMQLANQTDGVIVSNDNFRDLWTEKYEWQNIIKNRLLGFAFAGDIFMVCDDPMGRQGPNLDDFLSKPDTRYDHSQDYSNQQRHPSGGWNQGPQVPTQPGDFHGPGNINSAVPGFNTVPSLLGNYAAPSHPAGYPNQGQVVPYVQGSYPYGAGYRGNKQPGPGQSGQGRGHGQYGGAAGSTSSSRQQQYNRQQQQQHQPQHQSQGRSNEQYQTLFRQLNAVFPKNEDEIKRILKNHPQESDLNKLSSLILEVVN